MTENEGDPESWRPLVCEDRAQYLPEQAWVRSRFLARAPDLGALSSELGNCWRCMWLATGVSGHVAECFTIPGGTYHRKADSATCPEPLHGPATRDRRDEPRDGGMLRASPGSGRGDWRSCEVNAGNSRGADGNPPKAGEDGGGDVPIDPDVARDAVRTRVRPDENRKAADDGVFILRGVPCQRLKLNEAVEKVISKKIDKLEGKRTDAAEMSRFLRSL
eukprot:2267667-Pyramimonas_sp.AAC.1